MTASGAGGSGEGVAYENRRARTKKGSRVKRGNVKDRDWILRKKESARRKGLHVRPDSKYTGRKRSGKLY